MLFDRWYLPMMERGGDGARALHTTPQAPGQRLIARVQVSKQWNEWRDQRRRGSRLKEVVYEVRTCSLG